MIRETAKIGKRGVLVIPAGLRDRFGLTEGSLPIERYSRERKAQFLLSNAVNAKDYARAVEAVRAMGLDPEKIPHPKDRG